MASAKFKVDLGNGIFATLKLSLELSRDQKMKAEIIGIEEEEQKNIIGQELQAIIALLGNSDEV